MSGHCGSIGPIPRGERPFFIMYSQAAVMRNMVHRVCKMRRKYFETLSRPMGYVCLSLSEKNARVILSIALETLARRSNDDHDILHQIEYHDIPRGEARLRPDIVTCSQRILSSEQLKLSIQTSFSAWSPSLPPDTPDLS